jgi:lysine 2,3-aminomutase
MLNFSDHQTKREISLQRAADLKRDILDYLTMQAHIETGFQQESRTAENQAMIRRYFGASKEEWQSYSWQMKNRISDPDILAAFLPLSELEMWRLRMASQKVRWAISPYYLSLIDFANFRYSPIYMQAVPSLLEIQDTEGHDDPWERNSPIRLLYNTSLPRPAHYQCHQQCGMYCRHCQRRRNFGETDRMP